ncbi:hypothetical protein ACLOJK_001804 [Asimina triloba]
MNAATAHRKARCFLGYHEHASLTAAFTQDDPAVQTAGNLRTGLGRILVGRFSKVVFSPPTREEGKPTKTERQTPETHVMWETNLRHFPPLPFSSHKKP